MWQAKPDRKEPENSFGAHAQCFKCGKKPCYDPHRKVEIYWTVVDAKYRQELYCPDCK